MDVGARITSLREQQNLTTNRLANLCGLSQSFLRAVELGQKGITVNNLELVCQALQISLAEFFSTENWTETPEENLRALFTSFTPTQRKLLDELIHTIT